MLMCDTAVLTVKSRAKWFAAGGIQANSTMISIFAEKLLATMASANGKPCGNPIITKPVQINDVD